MRALTRRRFLRGVGASGVLGSSLVGALAACDSSDAPPPEPSTTRTIRTDVHVALGHLTDLSPEDLGRLAVHVAGKSFPLAPHTPETRKELLRGKVAGSADVTHFVRDVPFSTIGAQSYVVGAVGEEGIVAPVLGGIHVPSPDALADGEDQGADRPIKVASLVDCATYCVFHNPQVLSLDPVTAATVVRHILASSSFTSLVDAIKAAGPGKTPKQHAAGLSGWLYGEYFADRTGAQYPNVLFGETTPGARFRWIPAPAVEAATSACVAETLVRLHEDTSLEGVKFHTTKGLAAHAANAAAVLGLGEEEKFAFVFQDDDKIRGRRSIKVEKQAGNTFKIDVTNQNAVGTMVGMRSFRADGTVVADRLIGYVPATYYPSIEAAFGPSKAVFENIAIPAGATTLDLYSTAIATNAGDLTGPGGDKKHYNEGFGEFMGVLIMSGLLDFFVPLTCLALGLGGETARDFSLDVLREIVKEAGIEVLIDLAKTIGVEIFNAFTGHFSVDALIEGVADIAKGIFAAVVKFIARPAVAWLGVLVAAHVGAVVAASVVTTAIPIFGWVLKGVEVAQTAVQLGLQIVHIADGQLLVRSELVPAHPVSVVVKPDEKESAYLPTSAARCEITVTPEGRLPIRWEEELESSRRPALTVECPRPVALLGKLTVEVILRNGAGEIVAAGTVTVPNGTEVAKEQEVELEVKAVPVPIKGATRLVHKQRLVVTPAGRTFQATSAAPTADDTALSCASPQKVCRALGVTLSQRLGVLGYAFQTPSACAGGAAVSQVHLLSLVGAPPAVRSLPCGAGAPLQVALSLGEGPSVVVAQTPDRKYGVFKLDPAGTLPTAFDPKAALGFLKGDALVRARVHESGHLVALTNVGAEVIDLHKAERIGRPANPSLFVRRGQLRGQMSGAISVAPLPGLHGYALLEQGARRVQALDFEGNYLDLWARGSNIPLRSDAGRIFVDLEVDGAGNVWVLSYVPNGSAATVFALDVYSAKGEFIVTFDGVNALGLTIDLFGGVFTENAENTVGPGTYPEPSISIWSPENPK